MRLVLLYFVAKLGEHLDALLVLLRAETHDIEIFLLVLEHLLITDLRQRTQRAGTITLQVRFS